MGARDGSWPFVVGFEWRGFEASRGSRRGLGVNERCVGVGDGWLAQMESRKGRESVSWDFADKTVRAVRSVTGTFRGFSRCGNTVRRGDAEASKVLAVTEGQGIFCCVGR